MICEEWRPTRYEGYEVSSTGRVRSIPREVTTSNGQVRYYKGKELSLIPHNKGYVHVCIGSTLKVLVHRLVAQAFLGDGDEEREVDHINGIRDDNRVENLRWATTQHNQANRKKSPAKSSRFKGVYYNKRRSKWVSSIKVNQQRIGLGMFELEEDAARAYDAAAVLHFGEYAKVNFPV